MHAFLRIYKTFPYNLSLCIIILVFYAPKWRYCRHWKNWWNMLVYFWFRWNFRIIFTSINLFYYTFKICIKGAWTYFWYWLNSNSSLSSEGIIYFTKIFLFTESFMRFKFFFVLKKWRHFSQQKTQQCLDIIPFNNAIVFSWKIILLLSIWNHEIKFILPQLYLFTSSLPFIDSKLF